jgi:hypothetical protein
MILGLGFEMREGGSNDMCLRSGFVKLGYRILIMQMNIHGEVRMGGNREMDEC